MFFQWIVGHVLRLRALLPHGPRGDQALIEGIGDHLHATFGVPPLVYHELVSSKVHIDIHLVPPGKEREFHTLVTTGMAEKAMPVPEEVPQAARFVELVMMLPPEWQLEHRDFENERWYWPVRHMKMLARAPHEWITWFGPGHTIQFDEDMRPFAAGTSLCAYLLAPEPLGEGFSPVVLPDGREVTLLMAVPIYAEELAYAREHGSEALAQRFEEHDIGIVVDPQRVNVCKPE